MIIETIQSVFLRVKDVFANYDVLIDTLDIFLVAVLVYALITQLRKSQAIQVLKGLVFIVLIYGVVTFLGMKTSSFIFSRLFNDIILIFVILFSNEIRQALGHMGKGRKGGKISLFGNSNEDSNIEAINAVCRACACMGRSKVGSLILFERQTMLGDLTKQAISIDSETTFEMLCSIFWPKAPLHDGAVVISDGRIVAARCVVPLKNDKDLTENLGTRHRAAIEASINSDCVAVVTSEETGIVSVAIEGKLQRGVTEVELRQILGEKLLEKTPDKKTKKRKPKKENKKESAVKTAVTEEAPVEENREEIPETAASTEAENTESINITENESGEANENE